jgi:hypothetical protein
MLARYVSYSEVEFRSNAYEWESKKGRASESVFSGNALQMVDHNNLYGRPTGIEAESQLFSQGRKMDARIELEATVSLRSAMESGIHSSVVYS